MEVLIPNDREFLGKNRMGKHSFSYGTHFMQIKNRILHLHKIIPGKCESPNEHSTRPQPNKSLRFAWQITGYSATFKVLHPHLGFLQDTHKKAKANAIDIRFCTQGRTRTDTGLTPMVFETIASTNSATWAKERTLLHIRPIWRWVAGAAAADAKVESED